MHMDATPGGRALLQLANNEVARFNRKTTNIQIMRDRNPLLRRAKVIGIQQKAAQDEKRAAANSQDVNEDALFHACTKNA